VLAVVATAALIVAAWMAVLGHRQADRVSELRHANAAAVAHNQASSAQLSGMTAANSRAQARITQIDGDRQATAASMDALVHAWNEWLDSSNALVEASNRFVDQLLPLGSAVRSELDPRLRTVNDKGAAFQAAVVKFSAAAAKTRRDVGGTKP
jgi:hypothetical protein